MTERPAQPLSPGEAVEKALLFTFQLSNKDYRTMQTALSEASFIRALEQDGYTVSRLDAERAARHPQPLSADLRDAGLAFLEHVRYGGDCSGHCAEAMTFKEALLRDTPQDAGEARPLPDPTGWWHVKACIDRHDEDHNCLDEDGSIIGWREEWGRASPSGSIDVDLADALLNWYDTTHGDELGHDHHCPVDGSNDPESRCTCGWTAVVNADAARAARLEARQEPE